ncbi:MAG: RNA polymerase sigma factor [Halofilum sp. (in: g-proteobacteria)]|nr:RNA polymerase sigma factor [Halofilum sp. (in: g-proteobacteria)]
MDPSRPATDLQRYRFERALRPHMDALRRLALRLTGSRDDAEDLVQELMAHLYPRLEKVMALEQPRPWLTRVLYRLFVDGWRRRRANPVSDGEFDPDAGAGDPDDVPDAVFERRLTAERLQAALDGLRRSTASC